MTRHLHENSANAIDVASFSARERMIVRFLRTVLHPMTDREVMSALGFTDPNMTRPRITALIKRRVLAECPSVRDHQTGKTVRTVQIVARIQENILV